MSPDYLLQLTFSVFSAGKSQHHRSPTEAAEPGPARSAQSSTCHHRRYPSQGGEMSTAPELAASPPPPAPAPEPATPAAPAPAPAELALPLRGGRSTEEQGASGSLWHSPAGRVPQPAPPLPTQAGPAPPPPAPSLARLPALQSPQCPQSHPEPPSRARPGAAPTSAVS